MIFMESGRSGKRKKKIPRNPRLSIQVGLTKSHVPNRKHSGRNETLGRELTKLRKENKWVMCDRESRAFALRQRIESMEARRAMGRGNQEKRKAAAQSCKTSPMEGVWRRRSLRAKRSRNIDPITLKWIGVSVDVGLNRS